jgi:GH15 family glucan-1,4-alpha-glucosidase
MRKSVIIVTLCYVFLFCGACTHSNETRLKQSYFKLTTSNGLIAAVFNEQNNCIDYVYPHIFAHIDSVQYVNPFVGNIKINRTDAPLHTGYLQNTHVIVSEYPDFTVYYTASFVNHNKVFFIVVRGEKDKIENINFTANTIAGNEVEGIDHLENHYQDLPCLLAGNALVGSYMRLYNADIYEKYFLYSFTDKLHTNSDIIAQTIEQLSASAGSLVDAETGFMRAIIDRCNIPDKVSEKERNALEQSVSILKMSQVSDYEIFPYSHGQILASLRPGLWHIAWVRDASFAIEAMTRLGMYDEARKGLEFMLKAPANLFRDYTYTDGILYGPGVDYRISLTRYFGDGTEECDANEHGANIEYDDFGLFLTAYIDYVNRSSDWDFYAKWNEAVTTEVADAIMASCEANHLIKADSGPWEHQLENPKQYIFTSGVCARGLTLFAEAQRKQNLPWQKYETAAQQMKEAIQKQMLIDNKYFKGNANDNDVNDPEYWDGGTFEIFANGLVSDKELFYSHTEAYRKVLGIQGNRPGFIRLCSADPYENQEWAFINLRIAYAYLLFGDKKAAYPLINYVTEQAALNNNIIPEMYSNKHQMSLVSPDYYEDEVWCNCIRFEDNLYIATIPMVGYGSGAYALAVLAYYEL